MKLKLHVFTAAILLAVTGLLRAQSAQQGLVEVKDVAVEASGGSVATDPAEYVLSRVLAKPGAFISAADIARDQRALLDTGTFSDVKVLSEETAKGSVKLTYRVVIAPRYAPRSMEVLEKTEMYDTGGQSYWSLFLQSYEAIKHHDPARLTKETVDALKKRFDIQIESIGMK